MLEDGDRIRGRVHDALGVEQPDPSLRSRVMASMPVEQEEAPRWRWAMGGVAVALAIALVAGLVATRGTGGGPTPSSQVVGTLDVSAQLDFACTLPVRGPRGLATISLPSGRVMAEPDARPSEEAQADTLRRGRWLPVPAAWVSPDGRSYAFATSTSGAPGRTATSALSVHDVAPDRDRVVWTGPGGSQMLSWEPSGVVFMRHLPGSEATELWTVDPATGTARRLGVSPPDALPPAQPVVGGGAAWIATGDGRVLRLDLRDATLDTWFTAPAGRAPAILAVDAQGHPVLTLGHPAAALLLTAPGRAVSITDGAGTAFAPASAAGDAHGVWFASPGALWLYRSGVLTRVAAVPATLFPEPAASGKGREAPSPDAGPTLQLLGGCS